MKSNARDGIKVKGFFNVQILGKGGKVVGESGWRRNTVTNFGLDNACAGASIGAAGSKQVGFAVLATQSTTVDATQILLLGTQAEAIAVTPSTIATGKARCTVSFHGSDMAGTVTIGSIGLHSTDSGSTDMIAGATFATSQYASDQSVNATYQLEFS
jgi:hypothetical protein